MERSDKGYRLSTGREFYANGGILGIKPDDPTICTEGYDGGVMESWPREHWMDAADAEPSFTLEERAEIADHMIALWQRFKIGPHV